jgi:hypothetical protein
MLWTIGASGSQLCDFGNVKRFKSILGQSFSYGVKTDNVIFKTKILDIGVWDMSMTDHVNVAHGLDVTKIRSVDVIIRGDPSLPGPFSFFTQKNSSGVHVASGSFIFDATYIGLYREPITLWTGTNFDNTSSSYNRGWVKIEYEV